MDLYLDTSVIGGYFDDEFSKWSKLIINSIIEGKHYLVISDLTVTEINDAPDRVKSILGQIPDKYVKRIYTNDETEKLAKLYIKEKTITRTHYNDALHIAIASIYNVDAIVSWNFKHIVNLEKIRKYKSVNMKYGYKIIEIVTPMEVIYD